MKITKVESFVLKSDGTILFKTIVEPQDPSYLYCFYIYKGSEALEKSHYDKKSFISFKAPEYGKYQIKAFVKNPETAEKYSVVIPYVVNKSNARDLDARSISVEMPEFELSFTKSGDNTLSANAVPEAAGDYQYAWYIYESGNKEPVFKGGYSTEPSFTFTVNKSGTYYGKLFVKTGTSKFVYKTNEAEA